MKGAGQFTRLGLTGAPALRYSFTAKASKGTGEFTSLSVLAVPGQRRVFVAKSEAPIVVPIVVPATGGGTGGGYWGGYSRPRLAAALKTTDRDMIDMVYIIITSGVLDE